MFRRKIPKQDVVYKLLVDEGTRQNILRWGRMHKVAYSVLKARAHTYTQAHSRDDHHWPGWKTTGWHGGVMKKDGRALIVVQFL